MKNFLKIVICGFMVCMHAKPKHTVKINPREYELIRWGESAESLIKKSVLNKEKKPQDGEIMPEETMLYTDELLFKKTNNEEVSFKLLDKYAIEKLEIALEKSVDYRFKNHMFGRMVSQYYYDGKKKSKKLDFTYGLFKGIVGPPDENYEEELVINWHSMGFKGSGQDYFYRASNQKHPNAYGHSELQFIKDYKALWEHDSDAIVKKIVPKKNSKMLFSAMQLCSTFDSCHTCFTSLQTFKHEYLSSGKKSLADAVKVESKRKGVDYKEMCLADAIKTKCEKKGAIYNNHLSLGQEDTINHGLLIFNSAVPYTQAKYACRDDSEFIYDLTYKNKTIGEKTYKGTFSTRNNESLNLGLLSYSDKVAHINEVIYGNIALFSLYKPIFFKSKNKGVCFELEFSTSDIFE